MAIYTPRGLEINLPLPYAFALMQRLYPRVDAFKVLKTAEGLESIPSVLTFVSGLACFYLKADPYQTGLCILCGSVIGTVITLLGLMVPGLPLMGTLYSYVSGFGILFIFLVVYGFVAVGWQGVLAFFVGRLLAGIFNLVLEFWSAKRLSSRVGRPLWLSELNFLNAYRLHATATQKEISFREYRKEFERRIDTTVSEEELKEENWKPCFDDLAVKWPEVVRRFTG